MKKIIFVIVLLFAYNQAQAHEWDGVKWAIAQINLTNELIACAKEVIKPTHLFGQDCNENELAVRQELLGNELVYALDQHSNNYRTMIMAHYKKVPFPSKQISQEQQLGLDGFNAAGIGYSQMQFIREQRVRQLVNLRDLRNIQRSPEFQ